MIVREVEPVALVANQRGTLGAVDADGQSLPYEPGTPDLLVVPALDGGVVVLARVQVQSIRPCTRADRRGAAR